MPSATRVDVRSLIVAEPSGRYAARPAVVVDCSVLAAVLFDEPGRDDAALALAGRTLHAPDLLAHELVSVAVRKSIQGMSEVAEQALADFRELDLTRARVESGAQYRLALAYGIPAYDAAYLSLAAELKAPLVTFDRQLGEAAQVLLSRE